MKGISLLCVLYLFVSCSDDLDNVVSVNNSNHLDHLTTRSESPLTRGKGEWENWSYVKLVNISDSVAVPWNKSFVATSIPDDIRYDIRNEDGWGLIENSLNRKEPKMNYLIFYNFFTGVLKGFYYLEETSSGNNAYWQLEFPDKKKVFYNHDGYYTYPSSLNKDFSTIDIMNITTNKTKGLTVGWNCFQVELAYDPTQNQMLSLGISCYQQNIGSIDINGDFSSSSSGSIISNTPSASSSQPILGTFNKGNMSIQQDGAKQWILNNVGSGKPIINVLQSTVQGIMSNNISTLVKSGIGHIFGSLFGSNAATPTSYSLQFKTTGAITLSGKTEMPTTTAVPSIKINKRIAGGLGIWTMENAPVISIGQYAKVTDVRYGYGPSNNPIQLKYLVTEKIDPAKSPITINPLIEPYIRNLSIKYSFASGNMKDENLNYYSSTRENLKALYHSSSNRLISDEYVSSLKPETKYLDTENNIRIDVTPASTRPLIQFISYWNIDILPAYRCMSDGKPCHDMKTQKTAVATNDVKVVVEYDLNVNGKDKHFYSIRTFDPTIDYYINESPCVPFHWTKETIYSNFK